MLWMVCQVSVSAAGSGVQHGREAVLDGTRSLWRPILLAYPYTSKGGEIMAKAAKKAVKKAVKKVAKKKGKK
jgi:hypothetical protein